MAKKHRLRRLCERKPSGKLNVPLEVHEMWRRGGVELEALLVALEEANFNKDTACLNVSFSEKTQPQPQSTPLGVFPLEDQEDQREVEA